MSHKKGEKSGATGGLKTVKKIAANGPRSGKGSKKGC